MSNLRATGLSVLIAILLSLSVSVHAGEDESPDFSLMEYRSGETRSFENILLSRVNVMVVTSTTCSSCISELKALDRIRAKYKGEMTVTAIFVDRSGESRVYRYLDYYKFDLDMFLVDPGNTVPQLFGAPTVPTMIMFDSQGRERYRKTGFSSGDESLVIGKVEEILYGKRDDQPRVARGSNGKPRSPQTPAGPRTRGCASTG